MSLPGSLWSSGYFRFVPGIGAASFICELDAEGPEVKPFFINPRDWMLGIEQGQQFWCRLNASCLLLLGKFFRNSVRINSAALKDIAKNSEDPRVGNARLCADLSNGNFGCSARPNPESHGCWHHWMHFHSVFCSSVLVLLTICGKQWTFSTLNDNNSLASVIQLHTSPWTCESIIVEIITVVSFITASATNSLKLSEHPMLMV